MKSRNSFLAVVVALLGSSAFAQAPDPGSVYINDIVFGGTGCPVGSVAANISEDQKAFTLLYDSFTAEAGPGISLGEGRKACQVTLDLHIPQGWQYTLFTLDTRGFVALDAGASANIQSKYYFQGSLNGPALAQSFRGPVSGDYTKRDVLGIVSLVWSPCGISRGLNINTSARVAAGGGSRGLATVDSQDGEFRLLWGVQWRRC